MCTYQVCLRTCQQSSSFLAHLCPCLERVHLYLDLKYSTNKDKLEFSFGFDDILYGIKVKFP